MLVFILHESGEEPAKRTEASVNSAGADCHCMRLGANAAADMIRELRHYEEPFFIAMEAGDILRPDFFAVAGEWLRSLADCDAGITVLPLCEARSAEAAGLPPRAPLIWRTAAVLDGLNRCFAAPGSSPWEHYTLHEFMLLPGADWRWKTVRTDAFQPRHRRKLGWEQPGREWAWLQPVFAGRPSPPPEDWEPLISIVICTYNDASYLPWSVRSVYIQTFADWELLIVDDGSADDTGAFLQDSPMLRDRRVRVIRNGENKGKAHCLNQALYEAKGRWLLELDADDWLSPDCVETLARHADDGSEAGVLYGDNIEWQEREGTGKPLILKGIRSFTGEPSAEGLLVNPYPLAPRLYRISLLKKMNGWLTSDPSAGRLYEDLQMLIRIIMLKQPCIRIPGANYHRRIRLSSVTQVGKSRYESWKAWMKETIRIKRPEN